MDSYYTDEITKHLCLKLQAAQQTANFISTVNSKQSIVKIGFYVYSSHERTLRIVFRTVLKVFQGFYTSNISCSKCIEAKI